MVETRKTKKTATAGPSAQAVVPDIEERFLRLQEQVDTLVQMLAGRIAPTPAPRTPTVLGDGPQVSAVLASGQASSAPVAAPHTPPEMHREMIRTAPVTPRPAHGFIPGELRSVVASERGFETPPNGRRSVAGVAPRDGGVGSRRAVSMMFASPTPFAVAETGGSRPRFEPFRPCVHPYATHQQTHCEPVRDGRFGYYDEVAPPQKRRCNGLSPCRREWDLSRPSVGLEPLRAERSVAPPPPAEPPMVQGVQRHAVRVSTFDGLGNWAEFERQFETVARLNGWDTPTRAGYLAGSLRGAALAVLTSLSEEDITDYAKLKAALKLRFGDEHLAKLHLTQFETRVQGRGEDLATLGNDIERLARVALGDCASEVREKLASNRFINAVADPELRHSLRLAAPPSLRETIVKALEIEAIDRADFGSRRVRRTELALSQTQKAGSSRQDAEIVLLRKELSELRETLRSNPSIGAGRTEPCRSTRNTSWDRVVCWRCDQRGHMERFCPDRSRNASQRDRNRKSPFHGEKNGKEEKEGNSSRPGKDLERSTSWRPPDRQTLVMVDAERTSSS